MGTRKRRNGSPGQALEQVPAKAEDILVMATNNSSIVSKRSVERLYYPNEPHFFRFFVKKFQRRAPLINRGYHLRLHVIDVTLRNFLKQPSPKRKVVVNLGCGSDVIPWQCWTRYPEDCSRSRAVFVDVDFIDLIRAKRQIVLNTPELVSHLSQVEVGDSDPHVLLRSDTYCQVGIDLRHPATLEAALTSIVDLRDCQIMFVAEVSITYMETSAADLLIQWASTLGQAEFCLLEQILPDGPGHPFAQTMIAHFEKLSTPIKSVKTYQTIFQQYARFRERGWSAVQAQSLWSAWSNDSFLTSDNRQALDHIEPFDEWEEMALFSSHYLLLHARNYVDKEMVFTNHDSTIPTMAAETVHKQLTGPHGLRRFGAAMFVADVFGNTSIINYSGLGSNTRLSSYDAYTRKGCLNSLQIRSKGVPSSRMCFQMTDLGHVVLLTGGRSSPAKALSDCWLFKKDVQTWERTSDLPVPLFRHSACRLAGSFLALVMGGREGASGVSDVITVFNPAKGWLKCNVVGLTQPKLVFGAILTCVGRQTGPSPVFYGFFAGGLSSDGLINRQVLAWHLSLEDDTTPAITFCEAGARGDETARLLSRFGAAYIQYRDSLIVLGGVGCDGTVSHENDIVVFSTTESEIQAVTRLVIPISSVPQPLIVGSSIALTENQEIIIIGGAATCFSMGTFWTRGIYILQLPNLRTDSSTTQVSDWEFSHSGEIIQLSSDNYGATQDGLNQPSEVGSIARSKLDSREAFEKIITRGSPVLLEGLHVGTCLDAWSLEYLVSHIGEARKVVIHESQTKNMDFNVKNFRYTMMSFGEFAREVQKGRRLYLRALSADAPADRPASLKQDFPTLASDFVLPDQLKVCEDNLHSSILRISGPVNMWLHYDVQANVYCQIRGSKRMILFPPTDVTRLYFAPGASSSSINVFDCLDSPALNGIHPSEVDLHPGDVLYIPPLWLHTATPTSDSSIAVNVFFRSFDASQYSSGRDVYGNRDLAAYEKGRQEINRIVNAFNKTPDLQKQFYLLRLAAELAEKGKKS